MHPTFNFIEFRVRVQGLGFTAQANKSGPGGVDEALEACNFNRPKAFQQQAASTPKKNSSKNSASRKEKNILIVSTQSCSDTYLFKRTS